MEEWVLKHTLTGVKQEAFKHSQLSSATRQGMLSRHMYNLQLTTSYRVLSVPINSAL
jgi:hypothetical protein